MSEHDDFQTELDPRNRRRRGGPRSWTGVQLISPMQNDIKPQAHNVSSAAAQRVRNKTEFAMGGQLPPGAWETLQGLLKARPRQVREIIEAFGFNHAVMSYWSVRLVERGQVVKDRWWLMLPEHKGMTRHWGQLPQKGSRSDRVLWLVPMDRFVVGMHMEEQVGFKTVQYLSELVERGFLKADKRVRPHKYKRVIERG